MQKYLPSKIFIAVAASALFILGGGYFVFLVSSSKYQVLRENKNNGQPVVQNGEAAIFADKDTDGDGLKDWEEVLWHTDPNKADTDGDGTKDNDEILARRDPAKAGPNDGMDALAKTDALGASVEETKPQTLTETEQLARDFGEAYLRRKFSGSGSIDQNDLSKLLFSGVTKGLSEASTQPPEEVFIKDDFTVISDSSPHAIRGYLNRLGQLFSSNSSENALHENELKFALDAIQKEHLDELKKLLAVRDVYRKFANEMKTIPVPAVLAGAHRDMANSFWRLGLIAEQMSAFKEDPVGSFSAFSAYLVEARRSIGPLAKIMQQMEANNLVFREDEGGVIFNRYASLPLP